MPDDAGTMRLPAALTEAAGITPGWAVQLSPAAWTEAVEPAGPPDALGLARRLTDLLAVLVARLREPAPGGCPVVLDLLVDIQGRFRLRRLYAVPDADALTVHVLCPWELT